MLGLKPWKNQTFNAGLEARLVKYMKYTKSKRTFQVQLIVLNRHYSIFYVRLLTLQTLRQKMTKLQIRASYTNWDVLPYCFSSSLVRTLYEFNQFWFVNTAFVIGTLICKFHAVKPKTEKIIHEMDFHEDKK
jgi:hypothetical protein